MRVVPAGGNLFVQSLTYAAGDTELIGLLTGGIFPRLDRPPANNLPTAGDAPFAYLRELPITTTGRTGPVRAAFIWEVHGLPAHGTYTTRQAIERLEWLFRGAAWEPCTDSVRVPLRSSWQQTIGPVPDPGWHTIKYLGQFVVTAL